MDTNFLIAQICGVFSMASSICSMQFKKRKAILAALFCLNIFAALNMVFLGSLSAAYITFFAILEMLINYLFERKKRPVPKLIVGLYIIVNIALGALTFSGWLDLIPIICAIVFCATILTQKEQTIRKLMLIGQSLWLVFDLAVGAYVLSASNVLTIVSTAIALYRYRQKQQNHKGTKSKKGKND